MIATQSSSALNLNIRAADRATEIFVINWKLQRVANGTGELNLDVEPGLYKVRFRSGSQQHDELVEVRDGPVSLVGKRLNFESAAPLADTSTSHEYHAGPAQTLSRQVDRRIGHGSQLFVFLRDVDRHHPLEPDVVTIHHLDGALMCRITEGHVNLGDQFAAINLDLDPGTYRLRVDTEPMGIYESFITMSAGWQTQVFLIMDNFPVGSTQLRRPSIRRSSVHMAHIGRGFDVHGDSGRLTDLARLGLLQGRKVISRDEMNHILSSKFENPMLGIYAAHILLMSAKPNQALIDKVCERMAQRLGPHPDLSALQLRHGLSSSTPAFETPPMLMRSWDMVVEKSIRRASLVPRDSIAGQVADNLVSAELWLIHRVLAKKAKEEPEVSIASAQRLLQNLLKLSDLDKRVLINEVTSQGGLTGLESTILSSSMESIHPSGNEAHSDERIQRKARRLFRKLDAPRFAIADSIQSLVEKLNVKDS